MEHFQVWIAAKGNDPSRLIGTAEASSFDEAVLKVYEYSNRLGGTNPELFDSEQLTYDGRYHSLTQLS